MVLCYCSSLFVPLLFLHSVHKYESCLIKSLNLFACRSCQLYNLAGKPQLQLFFYVLSCTDSFSKDMFIFSVLVRGAQHYHASIYKGIMLCRAIIPQRLNFKVCSFLLTCNCHSLIMHDSRRLKDILLPCNMTYGQSQNESLSCIGPGAIYLVQSFVFPVLTSAYLEFYSHNIYSYNVMA